MEHVWRKWLESLGNHSTPVGLLDGADGRSRRISGMNLRSPIALIVNAPAGLFDGLPSSD